MMKVIMNLELNVWVLILFSITNNNENHNSAGWVSPSLIPKLDHKSYDNRFNSPVQALN